MKGLGFAFGVLFLLACVPGACSAGPLFVAVVPDLPGSSSGDEGFAISSDVAMDVGGWRVTDGEGSWTIPAPMPIPAGQAVWFANEAAAWAPFGQRVDHEWGRDASRLELANSGDSLQLIDLSGAVVDAFSWGGAEVGGMAGSVDYTSPGLVYERALSPGGRPIDSDSSGAWVTPRMHRVGETQIDAPTFAVSHLTLYSSPDSSFGVLRDLLARAERRVHVHVYEWRSWDLMDAVLGAKAARPGLDVQVLVEGEPVGLSGWDRHEEAAILQRIVDAGGHVVTAGTNGQPGGPPGERYHFHHLKVAVVDDAVAVQSENWVPTGVPVEPSVGNRGWGVVIHDADVADWFDSWMAQDRTAWDAAPFTLGTFDPTYRTPARFAPDTGDYAPRVAAVELHGAFTVRPVVSPDATADSRTDPVALLAASARHRLDVQQLDVSLDAANKLGWHGDDALAAAMRTAAAGGAVVRLQAAAPFSEADTDNADALAQLAQDGSGRVATRTMARPGIVTLHNKGFVADDAVALGSMNANHHSRSENREVDVILTGPGVADFYDALFQADWDPPAASRDWGVPGQDLKGLPGLAPLPILLAAIGVACVLRRHA